MISLEVKTDTATSNSPLTLNAEKGDSPKLSFSQLLSGIKSQDSEELVQNGTLVLALEGEVKTQKTTKTESLLSLLKSDKTTKEEVLSLDLNPQLTKNLTEVELKVLVSDAKKYLKTKIVESAGFKKSEIEALPKTLKGLMQVAEKFGIKIGEITLDDVKPEIKTSLKEDIKTKSQTFEALVKNKAPLKEKEISSTIKVSLDVKKSPELQTILREEKPLKKEPLVKHHKSTPLDVVEKSRDAKELKPQTQTSSTVENDVELEEAFKRQTREKELPSLNKQTPLFKAQTPNRVTTQELVQTKLSSVNVSQITTPKVKADETLKMLLRGEKVSKKDTSFTADFSVATARVIAPEATTEKTKNLESLLRGEQQESASTQKSDFFNVAKADSLEVKMHEAKQMSKYLSQDIKNAIEDYKSPFTRVKVQLNPERLGSVELTVVQRGKNLHINLSSNNAAINALAMNANDLKVQLTNNGINNASLNFNNSSQSSESSFSEQQRQNSQQGKEAHREYNYFDNEEQNEEIVNSLEIVVPSYA